MLASYRFPLLIYSVYAKKTSAMKFISFSWNSDSEFNIFLRSYLFILENINTPLDTKLILL